MMRGAVPAHRSESESESESLALGGAHAPKVSSAGFYGEYHGHPVKDLPLVLSALRARHGADAEAFYFAGDSSLDNKHWVPSAAAEACNGYADALSPPRSREDVCYWMNRALEEEAGETADRHRHRHRHRHRDADSKNGLRGSFAVNGAVEATTLRQRSAGLLPHDAFVRDSLSAGDTLVVSIGGNDIALAPTSATVLHMLAVVYLASTAQVRRGSACGLGHFVRLFKDQVQSYVEKLVAKQSPRLVLLCMIYFPSEQKSQSWADTSLGAMRYNGNPAKLQAVIKVIFDMATAQVKVPGTTVVPVPLFEALDPKDAEQYVCRVEPSSKGGRHMAKFLLAAARMPLPATAPAAVPAPKS